MSRVARGGAEVAFFCTINRCAVCGGDAKVVVVVVLDICGVAAVGIEVKENGKRMGEQGKKREKVARKHIRRRRVSKLPRHSSISGRR